MDTARLLKTNDIALLTVVLLLLGFCGCNSPKQPTSILNEMGLVDTEFSIRVLPESTAEHAVAEFNSRIVPTADAVRIEVWAESAAELTALYFSVEYNPVAWHPVGVEYSGLSDDRAELLTLEVQPEEGRLDCGQVLIDCLNRPGLTGNALLASVHFAKGPDPHRTSDPPTSSDSQVEPHFVSPGVLSWLYCNTGDYDQNGEVNVSDLTPLAIHFGSTGPFDAESEMWMIDGDGNSELNLSDITPIAVNYRSTVTEYEVMAILPGGEDPLSLGILDFDDAFGEEGARLAFEAYVVGADGTTPQVHSSSAFTVLDPATGSFWDYTTEVVVTPSDGTTLGIASEPVSDTQQPGQATLEFDAAGMSGNGTFEDPYLLSIQQDLASNPLEFRIWGDGFSIEPDRIVPYINREGFGTFSFGTGGRFQFDFELPPTERHAFCIYARYDGVICSPTAYYFVMVDPAWDPPVLGMPEPPAQGSGTAIDPYIVPDVTVTYEFSLEVAGTDVSTSPGAMYTVSPEETGALPMQTAILTYNENLGLYMVTAEYCGVRNVPDNTIFMTTQIYGPGEWWCFGHDRQNTHRSESVGPVTPVIDWTYEEHLNGIDSGFPVVGADAVLYFNDNINAWAINTEGAANWNLPLEWFGSNQTSLAILEGGLIINGGNNVSGYNANGYELWRSDPYFGIIWSPTIAEDGTIYATTHNDGLLFAMHPDGTLLWEFDLPGGDNRCVPALAHDGTIYVVEFRTLYAVNPDGTQKWTYTMVEEVNNGDDYSPSVAADGTIYVGSNASSQHPSGVIYAINPDGSEKWKLGFPGDSFADEFHSLAVAPDGTVYASSNSIMHGYLHCISPEGVLQWTFDTDPIHGGSILNTPVLDADGTVYFTYRNWRIGGTVRHMYAVNPDGSYKWDLELNFESRGSPIIASDGLMYLVCGGEDAVYRIVDNP